MGILEYWYWYEEIYCYYLSLLSSSLLLLKLRRVPGFCLWWLRWLSYDSIEDNRDGYMNIYVNVGIFELKDAYYFMHGTLNIAFMWQEALQLNVKHIL